MGPFDKQAFDATYEDLLKRGVIEESTSEVHNSLWDMWAEAWELGRDHGLEGSEEKISSSYDDGWEDGHQEGWDEGYEEGMEEADAS